MLNKLFYILIFLLLLLNVANASKYKDIEVYAKKIIQHQDSVEITGGVVVRHNGDILSSNSAVYKAKEKILILEDNVTIVNSDKKKINANSVKINLHNSKILFKNFFMAERDNIWISSKNAKRKDNKISLKNAIFSACCIKNPDWSIGLNKAIYHTKKRELKVDGAKIFFKDLQIFYLPHLNLSLSKKRKSGFLTPTFRYVKHEGILYNQPYFWAIAKNQDMQFDLQVRTNRGLGGYITYRLVDSNDSSGKIRVGYFKDKNSYTKKHNLKYKEHYGVELYYLNNTLIDALSSSGYENKLYLNALYMNNTDYLNLQVKDKFKHRTIGEFYESRLNYYIKNDSLFTGISWRYFKDTTRANNKNTLQIFPKIDFHVPYTIIAYDNLSYIVDAQIINYTRASGTKSLKAKISMPFSFHYSFLDDYLSLNLTEELETTGYNFYSVPIDQKKYSSIVLNHTVNLRSDLAKIYKNGMHTAIFSTTYTKSSIVYEKWMKYQDIPKELKIDFVDKIPIESKITFGTDQYWHHFDNRLDINYDLKANYHFKESRFKDLEQEFKVNYKNLYFYSKLYYSLVYNQSKEIYNKIGYSNSVYGLFFEYLWKKDFLDHKKTTKELNLNGYYNRDENLKFTTKVIYNLKDKELKNWEFGIYLNRKCWGIGLSFGQNIKPVIKSDGNRGSISNNYIKVKYKIPFF